MEKSEPSQDECVENEAVANPEQLQIGSVWLHDRKRCFEPHAPQVSVHWDH
ncbi:unnamed protein product [Anisakis simplex]|uniref:Uncharacterized protein n=1 Tax=Anisakis simplex TaxID=6269 RepID=A0A0M3K804_ANISI|nr:unnamed protein product [Anisakis simplex]